MPKIEVTCLGDYTRNVGYKTGSITYEFETKTFNYDRGIKLLADVMDVEKTGGLNCFVNAGSKLQRTWFASEGDAFVFVKIARHRGATPTAGAFSDTAPITCRRVRLRLRARILGAPVCKCATNRSATSSGTTATTTSRPCRSLPTWRPTLT